MASRRGYVGRGIAASLAMGMLGACIVNQPTAFRRNAPPIRVTWNIASFHEPPPIVESPLYVYIAADDSSRTERHAHALCAAYRRLMARDPAAAAVARLDVPQLVWLYKRSQGSTGDSCSGLVRYRNGAQLIRNALIPCTSSERAAFAAHTYLRERTAGNELLLVVTTVPPRAFQRMLKETVTGGGAASEQTSQRICRGRYMIEDVGRYSTTEALEVYDGLLERLAQVRGEGPTAALEPSPRVERALREIDGRLDAFIFRR
jgi:hypothetical protein